MTSTSAETRAALSRLESTWRGSAKRAAEQVTRCGRLELPLVGSVPMPPADQLAFLGGVATLVALGVVEWPVAVLLGAGHVLATQRDNRLLSAFGDALEHG
jgi:hypothetical protein